jgi:hypothetical protein
MKTSDEGLLNFPFGALEHFVDERCGHTIVPRDVTNGSSVAPFGENRRDRAVWQFHGRMIVTANVDQADLPLVARVVGPRDPFKVAGVVVGLNAVDVVHGSPLEFTGHERPSYETVDGVFRPDISALLGNHEIPVPAEPRRDELRRSSLLSLESCPLSRNSLEDCDAASRRNKEFRAPVLDEPPFLIEARPR